MFLLPVVVGDERCEVTVTGSRFRLLAGLCLSGTLIAACGGVAPEVRPPIEPTSLFPLSTTTSATTTTTTAVTTAEPSPPPPPPPPPPPKTPAPPPPRTTPKPPPPPPPPRTDRRYRTCKEAKAHGLGPYVLGVHPEYHWYRDADKDGIVCE